MRDHLIVHNGGGASGRLAVRQGPWTYIPPGGNRRPGAGPKGKQTAGSQGPVETSSGELYNLAADLSEATNVAREHPDVVARLRELLKRDQEAGRSRP